MANIHIIQGRLGRDPELKDIGNNNHVVNFSVATGKKWTDKEGNKQEKTTWHNCSAFGKQAQAIAMYMKKGSMIFIEGEIQKDTVEKPGGEKVTYVTTRVNRFEFVGSSQTDVSVKPQDVESPAALDNHAPF